jgi:hypothetical protein
MDEEIDYCQYVMTEALGASLIPEIEYRIGRADSKPQRFKGINSSSYSDTYVHM